MGGQLTTAMATTRLVAEGARIATSTMAKMKEGMVWKNIGEPHQRVVDESSVVTRHRPYHGAEGHRCQGRDDGDDQRRSRAVHQARPHAAPQGVGAECVVAKGLEERLVDDLEGVAGREQRRQTGHHYHQREPGESGNDPRIAEKALPKAFHLPNVMRGSRNT